jgi:hypothetical protein
MPTLFPKDFKEVVPAPYFGLIFGCGNRSFYQVKSDLYSIAERIGIDISDGYLSEYCDYEGDLEKIRIYNCERGRGFIYEVLDFYNIDRGSVPDSHDLVLSIF